LDYDYKLNVDGSNWSSASASMPYTFDVSTGAVTYEWSYGLEDE